MRYSTIGVAGVLMVAMGAGCDEEKPVTWYKGNTHTHSLWSDGNEFPDMIAQWYAEQGYDFLVLSDHNILSRGEKWMKLSEIVKRRNPNALAHYKEHFGAEWVQTRGEGASLEVRLRTLEEVRQRFEKPGEFVMIEGEEITDAWGKLPVHINAVNLTEAIQPQRGDSVRDVIRRNLAAVREQAERTGKPILAHLNHPNFRWGVTAEDIAHVVEEPFVEVFNGHPGSADQGDELHPSSERIWDIASTIRIAELDAPPPFGVATDDSHHYHEAQADHADHAIPGRGWVMVNAEELSGDAIVRAMIAGRFYASSGVTLKRVDYDAGRRVLRVVIDPAEGRTYTVRFIGTRKGYDATSAPRVDSRGVEVPSVTRVYSDDVGATLAEHAGVTEATFKLDADALYVRAQITSDKAPRFPIYEGQVETAWTQPVGWESHVDTGP